MNKSRAELDNEIMELIKGRDMGKIKTLMSRHFRACKFEKLEIDQMERFVLVLQDAIYKGEV